MPDRERARRVTEEFTRQAQPLSRSAAFNDSEIVRHMREAVRGAPGSTVLDLACGPGIVLAELARDAETATGIDATPAMIDLARARCENEGLTNVRLECGEAESLPFGDASFDAVATRLSIHHFVDPAAVLWEARRVLKPGGRLVIADVVSRPVPHDAALHNALEMLRDPTHVRMLPADELRALVEEAGYAIESMREVSRAREFEEWATIIGAPERLDPIRIVMSALARAGIDAGIGLRLENDRIRFDHTWAILTATR